jgi:putative ATP-dependent endonuclease of the OLD family
MAGMCPKRAEYLFKNARLFAYWKFNMAKVKKLEIKNFRGLKDFSMNFGDENIICFIGRGDSGKTTVLEAISSVLSSNWNLMFHDSDFYNCDLTNPISIEVSLIDIPERLLSDEKYGLYIRFINVNTNEIIDDVFLDEGIDNSKPILTIRLEVDKALEPKWTVINARAQDEKQISAADRASLNCTMVLDYVDKHFSWSKGSSLHSLLRETSDDVQKNNIIIESLRQAKEKIDQHDFSELESVTNIIKNKLLLLG